MGQQKQKDCVDFAFPSNYIPNVYGVFIWFFISAVNRKIRLLLCQPSYYFIMFRSIVFYWNVYLWCAILPIWLFVSIQSNNRGCYFIWLISWLIFVGFSMLPGFSVELMLKKLWKNIKTKLHHNESKCCELVIAEISLICTRLIFSLK